MLLLVAWFGNRVSSFPSIAWRPDYHSHQEERHKADQAHLEPFSPALADNPRINSKCCFGESPLERNFVRKERQYRQLASFA